MESIVKTHPPARAAMASLPVALAAASAATGAGSRDEANTYSEAAFSHAKERSSDHFSRQPVH
jgi:hypothetical protein